VTVVQPASAAARTGEAAWRAPNPLAQRLGFSTPGIDLIIAQRLPAASRMLSSKNLDDVGAVGHGLRTWARTRFERPAGVVERRNGSSSRGRAAAPGDGVAQPARRSRPDALHCGEAGHQHGIGFAPP